VGNVKKLIASVMMAVLFAALLASPIAASSYDPHRPPWVYLLQPGDADSGDDSGWGEVTAITPPPWAAWYGITAFLGPHVRLVIVGFIVAYPDSCDDNGNTDTTDAQPCSGTGSR
jgi:hypothetical protein